MEDVLAVYTRPAILIARWSVWTRPQSKCLPRPRADPDEARRPARFDYEYERNGTANLFMMFARSKARAMSKSSIATPR